MKTVVLAASLLLIAAIAQAETVAPAAAAPATTVAAQPVAARANGEHPGVIAARQYRQGAVDANRFIVAPPASTRWTSGPALDVVAPTTTAAATAR